MTVLCYHSVDPNWVSPLAVRPWEFERHCAWLRRRGVADLTVAVANEHAGRRGYVALTFDDGFQELFTHAFPTLVRFGLPATVFVVAGTLIDPPLSVDWVDDSPDIGLTTLSREQILEMRAAGVAFGSHSFRHLDLTALGDAEVERDLRESREVLEDLLKEPVPFVAYPRGRHDERVRRAAERAGFARGFSLPERREPIGPFAVPRVGIYPGNGPWILRAKSRRAYLAFRRNALYGSVRTIVRRHALYGSVRTIVRRHAES